MCSYLDPQRDAVPPRVPKGTGPQGRKSQGMGNAGPLVEGKDVGGAGARRRLERW